MRDHEFTVVISPTGETKERAMILTPGNLTDERYMLVHFYILMSPYAAAIDQMTMPVSLSMRLLLATC